MISVSGDAFFLLMMCQQSLGGFDEFFVFRIPDGLDISSPGECGEIRDELAKAQLAGFLAQFAEKS